jgi:hypothetical protein
MNVQLLIDSIMRQTTVLIAQLATSGGVRAPLAHIANQVFLELAAELDNQGVSRKVSADMFGLGLRTYLRKIQRLSESSTEQGRSLWEAILDYLSRGILVSRAELLQRFHRDDEVQVRGVLKDLMDSGLVFSTGTAHTAVFRAATAEELGRMQAVGDSSGLDELLWAFIYREGPITRGALLKRGGLSAPDLDSALERLQSSARISSSGAEAAERAYRATELVIPLGAAVGWEAAVFDHFQAMVRTISARLTQGSDSKRTRGQVGGSTYSFDVWDQHPLAEEVLGLLQEFRARAGELRQRVEAHNAAAGVPESFAQVTTYIGQSVLEQGDES